MVSDEYDETVTGCHRFVMRPWYRDVMNMPARTVRSRHDPARSIFVCCAFALAVVVVPKPSVAYDARTTQPRHLAIGRIGMPIDGIPCETEMTRVHLHAHLSIFINGARMQLPGGIGIVSTRQGGCLYWLHTHEPDGIIHVESTTPNAPQGGRYTLGMFFDIWGKRLSRNRIARFRGPVTAFVDGSRYTGDPRGIPLRRHQRITLELGHPIVMPPNYLFPPGY